MNESRVGENWSETFPDLMIWAVVAPLTQRHSETQVLPALFLTQTPPKQDRGRRVIHPTPPSGVLPAQPQTPGLSGSINHLCKRAVALSKRGELCGWGRERCEVGVRNRWPDSLSLSCSHLGRFSPSASDRLTCIPPPAREVPRAHTHTHTHTHTHRASVSPTQTPTHTLANTQLLRATVAPPGELC